MRIRGLVIASFSLVSAIAQADDVVVLKDGTILEGKIGEMVPNQSITITVEGQARKVDWKDIERMNIDRPKTQALQQPAAARTMVHIDGVGPDAYVQMLDQHGTTSWTEVCKGACDQELPSDGLYRVDGAGIRASQPFRVEGAQANLQAKTASSLGFAGGLSLVIFGGVALVNGLSFFLVAAIDQNVISSNTQRDFFITAGLVLGGVGIASMIVGGLLLASNLRTTVAGATTLRVPAWRDFPRAPSSMALSFPAISGSF